MRKYLLPESGNFYKANLHSHSNLSDGRLSPAEMKELYKKNGYSVLAYTDHDILIPHNDLTDDEFVALVGFEASINQEDAPAGVWEKRCHLCFIAKTPDMDIQPCWNPKY
ncbi:MAG: PHP domain-containing protein, partial [Ruminococcaceae bacterium]|nr:PHP domain-containing protein [Oscillospiraceae bacterium]